MHFKREWRETKRDPLVMDNKVFLMSLILIGLLALTGILALPFIAIYLLYKSSAYAHTQKI